MKTISFKHMGNAGDIIYALSGIKQICERLGKKANLFIWLNRPAFYYEGAQHPVKDMQTGQQVTMNAYMLKMIRPLLESQPYINIVKEWEGEEIHVDLDRTKEVNVNMPYGDVRKWYGYVFPYLQADLGKPALNIPSFPQTAVPIPYILVNRTQRYFNPLISYMFLRNYENVIFAGTIEEFQEFQSEVPNAHHLQVKDFNELAMWIKSARFFIGNQSMCFAIAEQLKTPRIMETCRFAPNVIPVGEDALDFYTQECFEEHVRTLAEKY